jgi:hypothetical protein
MDANTKDKSNRRLTQIDADRIFDRRLREFTARYLRPSAPARHSFSNSWFTCGLPLSSRPFVSIRGSFSSFFFAPSVFVVKSG